jgi:ABC-type Fe3+/spermidine/putrescine transport system ATPase subunit
VASVRIDQLSIELGGQPILKGVSLEIADGECVALLGPSGCGKTTTLRAIAGFLRPDSGSIALNGRCVDDAPPYRRNVGLVFQDYALFPHMTIAENVAYGLRMRGYGRDEISKQVSEALERVQLAGFQNRLPAQLSGGQRQRVALARAIIIQPDVLLLDEPLGALDRKLRDGMQVELKRLQRELAITTLIVTHDQEEALSLSDRVAVMFGGQIAAVDTPRRLYSRPPTADIMAFLGRANFIHGVHQRVGDVAGVRIAPATWIGGTLASAQQALAEGQAATIGVRPEHLKIVPDTPDNPEIFTRARIVDIIYRGASAELILVDEPQTGDGPVLTLSADVPAADLRFGRDDPVGVKLASEHCLIFPMESP